jgi:hypothetical protein
MKAAPLPHKPAFPPVGGNIGGNFGRVNTSREVEEWLGRYEHPVKDAMLRVREIILADDRITETIKWQSPTFMYKGNMASFMPRTKAHVSLIFHQGASIPGKHPRLIGGGDTGRYMKFADLAEANAAEKEIKAVVAAWCESR